MDFNSYKDDVVSTAVALVNHLTPGLDGTSPYAVGDSPAVRQEQINEVGAFAGSTMADGELDGFVQLAARLRPVFERCDVGDLDGAAATVNDLLRSYRSAPELSRHDDDPWHLHFHSRAAGVAEGWGAGCATGLALVIGTGESGRLGICTAAPCDRVFVDTSRNGTRRFCSPRCTNRAAVSAFRERRQTSDPATSSEQSGARH